MPLYEVEYGRFKKVRIEAEDLAEAIYKANVIADEDIDKCEDSEPKGYIIWDGPKEVKQCTDT